MARKSKKTTNAKKTANATKAPKRRTKRVEWTAAQEKELRGHSKQKTPVTKISRAMKRTVGALRQKARTLGIPLGHRR